MALVEVPSPAVRTVEVPCADGATCGSLCPTLSATVTCSSSPAAQLDFAPNVNVNGILFTEIHRSYFVSINVAIDPQRGNLVALDSGHNELLLHEIC